MMNQPAFSSDLVLETLLKTNRPPTDQEKMIIRESMASTTAKLRAVEEEISNAIAHIQALKSQVERADITLLRLHEEKAAILKTSEDHRRVLSAVRYLPEDVLREICITCVEDNILPELSDCKIPSPYALAQISSGMRHIVLTSPIIWARMDVPYYFGSNRMGEQAYINLARGASEWFERAGGLPLTLYLHDPTSAHTQFEEGDADPSSILFDTLFSYSSRWKEIRFKSSCQYISRPMIRIAALTAADLPLLQSVSLDVECFVPSSALSNTGFLTVPTLKHVSLKTNSIRRLKLNWAVLTSVSLYAKWDTSSLSRNELASILQQTKCLIICEVWVNPYSRDDELPLDKITLPFLESLHFDERNFGSPSCAAPSLLDLIIAPALATLDILTSFLPFSLSAFLERSPRIQKISLPYLSKDTSLMETTGFLRRCPSLSVLTLWPCSWENWSDRPSHWNADTLLRSFVEESDVGIVCPRLQCFRFSGEIDFSLDTLRLFLEEKQPKIAAPDVMPWKRVNINIGSITDTETRQRMLALISQKKAEGLNVNVY